MANLLNDDACTAASDGSTCDGHDPGEESEEASEKRNHKLCYVLRHQLVVFREVEDVNTLKVKVRE